MNLPSTPKVLIVDDDHYTRTLLNRLIGKTADVRLAADGSTRVGEAVGAIRKMSETVIGASERIRALETLQALPGIGPWTAHYLAMRTLHWEDAWPVQDVALQSALRVRQLAHPTKALEDMGQAWRPFRSYALMAAWARATPSHLDPENP